MIKLKHEKKTNEFTEQYLNLKDIIPTFLFKVQETEDMIKLFKSSNYKGDKTEIQIFSDYIKDLKKNKLKKITSLQKKGDKLTEGMEKKNDNDNNNDNDIEVNNIKNEWEELDYKLIERGEKISEIQKNAEKLEKDSIAYKDNIINTIKKYPSTYKEDKEEDLDFDTEGIIRIKNIICFLCTIFIIIGLVTTLLIFLFH